MAISVDTVYQRVLALANKEQRGYITPQEFNLLANQAQMSIFESYFYAKNQRDRAEPTRTNEVDESDRIKDLHLKARKQDKLAKKAKEATKMPISAPYKREKKGLTVEDFERAKLTKKQKNKTLSSNF